LKPEEKARFAVETIKRCMGRYGFYASADLYLKQYWIRDMVYSIDPLLDLGYSELVKRQLTLTLERQKSSGEVPTLIFDDLPSISVAYRLAKTLSKRGLKQLVHRVKTYDSNLLTLIGVYKYVERTGDEGFLKTVEERVNRLWGFVNRVLVNGLIPGADWRDSMLNYSSRFTFSNQILLISANRLAGRLKEAEWIKDVVEKAFWDEDLGHYRDHQNSTHFDTLGHTLAILEGLIHEDRLRGILRGFEAASTRFGFKNIQPGYREDECGQRPGYYQNSTVWPFIQGFAIKALVNSGIRSRAEEEFGKFTDLLGFNEWYNLAGRPDGSSDQLWSAASYLRAYSLM